MNASNILYPVLAQVFLVFMAFMLLGQRRLKAVKTRKVDFKEAALSNRSWPSNVILVSNNIANQSEVPVLFYTLALVAYVTDSVSMLNVMFAWLFVVSRYCHAYVHVTKNVILLRLRFFLSSLLFAFLMFVSTLINLVTT